MNAFQINFSRQSKVEIESICTKHLIKFDELWEKHRKFKFYKVFIDLDSFKMFAYVLQSNTKKLEFTDAIDEVILSIKPEVADKKEVVEQSKTKINIEVDSEIALDIDSILDKITKFGIKSLTKTEKDFLDNSSKL